jgi:ribosomal protein L37AE/L43A
MKVVVDRERCVVECGDCGSQLDPFAVLLRYALEETSLRGLIERKTSIDKEYEERRTIKNSTCRHTRARQMSTGVWYCPSCDLQWNKAISMKTKEATDA